MKITKIKLEQIIKEELEATLNEVPSAQIAAMRRTKANVQAQSPEAKKRAAAEEAAMMQRYKEDEERRAAEEARPKTCEELKKEYEDYAKDVQRLDPLDQMYHHYDEKLGELLKTAKADNCPWAAKFNQPAEKPQKKPTSGEEYYGFKLEETKLTKSKLVQVIREEIANTLGELNVVPRGGGATIQCNPSKAGYEAGKKYEKESFVWGERFEENVREAKAVPTKINYFKEFLQQCRSGGVSPNVRANLESKFSEGFDKGVEEMSWHLKSQAAWRADRLEE